MGVVFFVGSEFGVIKFMGLLDASVFALTDKLKDKGLVVIAPVVMIAIALNVTFTGMRELDVIFITLMIPICIRLGYDAMTALGVVLLASCAVFMLFTAMIFVLRYANKVKKDPTQSLLHGMDYQV